MKSHRMEPRGWQEFKDSKLLWWVNRSLHIFGWAIVCVEEEGKVVMAIPARVSRRGFSAETEAAGFAGLSQMINENAAELLMECQDTYATHREPGELRVGDEVSLWAYKRHTKGRGKRAKGRVVGVDPSGTIAVSVNNAVYYREAKGVTLVETEN